MLPADQLDPQEHVNQPFLLADQRDPQVQHNINTTYRSSILFADHLGPNLSLLRMTKILKQSPMEAITNKKRDNRPYLDEE